MKTRLLALLVVVGCPCARPGFANEVKVAVKIDASEAPNMKEWAESAKALIVEWYPRIVNLLPTKEFQPNHNVTLKVSSTYKGVANTNNATGLITVSAHWVENHPDDTGFIIHELVHVIQGYHKPDTHWLTEGIADYVRWVIYEGKPQHWFHPPKEKEGYKKAYRHAAGFLLWLETDRAPGIVNRINRAMRHGKYSDAIFHKATGHTLDELWELYVNQGEPN